LARFALGERSIVGNVNFFMSVPVLADGRAGVAGGVSQPGSYVELRAERDVLAVLSNCQQITTGAKKHGQIFAFTTSIRMDWSAKDHGSRNGSAPKVAKFLVWFLPGRCGVWSRGIRDSFPPCLNGRCGTLLCFP
jgi:uncharacterized protein YcgI (DUF1989 family)